MYVRDLQEIGRSCLSDCETDSGKSRKYVKRRVWLCTNCEDIPQFFDLGEYLEHMADHMEAMA